jgi:hypothetical protein
MLEAMNHRTSGRIKMDKPDGSSRQKTRRDKICVDLRKLNDACLHDPFPTPFMDEVLENVGGHEVYSFTNRFSGYHQINIAQEDRYKTTFAIEWGS